jgi:hypothetical protein
MEPIILQQVVDCPGATIRNDALQPASDPILTPHPKSSRWADLPSTAIRAGSKEPFGSNLKLAASARFPVTSESLSETDLELRDCICRLSSELPGVLAPFARALDRYSAQG